MSQYDRNHKQWKAQVLNRVCSLCNTKLNKAIGFFGWECPLCRKTYSEEWFLGWEKYMDYHPNYGYPDIKKLKARKKIMNKLREEK